VSKSLCVVGKIPRFRVVYTSRFEVETFRVITRVTGPDKFTFHTDAGGFPFGVGCTDGRIELGKMVYPHE
jgi:hypothetical protein